MLFLTLVAINFEYLREKLNEILQAEKAKKDLSSKRDFQTEGRFASSFHSLQTDCILPRPYKSAS